MDRHVDGDKRLAGRTLQEQSGESERDGCSAKLPDGNNFTMWHHKAPHDEPGTRAEARPWWNHCLHWIGGFEVEAEQPGRGRPSENRFRGQYALPRGER